MKNIFKKIKQTFKLNILIGAVFLVILIANLIFLINIRDNYSHISQVLDKRFSPNEEDAITVKAISPIQSDKQKVNEASPKELSSSLQTLPPANKGRTIQENFLSVSVLLFGLLVCTLLTIAMKSKSAKLLESTFTKLVGLTVVITAGVFLICAGYSQSQIATMMGLLGTIAGYLLGKEVRKRTS